jgi:hypothetical protein
MSMARKFVSLVCVVALSVPYASLARANTYYTRQYYSTWRKHPQRSYHYRYYYYKPSTTYVGYKHHYVIYYPSRPRYAYFYNPYRKVYWGRCPIQTGGKGEYSLLAEKDRKGTLEEIPEAAFPKPGPVPPVPESSDGVAMELPPDDLPADDALPKQ